MGNDNPYRVYNHTERELIVATDVSGKHQFRLLPRCASPRRERPRLLWMESGERIDGAAVWRLAPGLDVHVSEAGSASPLGDNAPQHLASKGPSRRIHVSGLGVRPDPRSSPPRTTATQPWFYDEDQIWVTVLGAGITGLTVAHELVTRGFRVQVIERAHGSPADVTDGDTGAQRFKRGLTAPDIGGIARTQWVTQPLARSRASTFNASPGASPSAVGTVSMPRASATVHSVHGDRVWFGAGRGGPQAMGTGDDAYQAFGVMWSKGRFEEFAADLANWLYGLGETRSVAAVQLVVVVYEGDARERVERAYARLQSFLDALVSRRRGKRTSAMRRLCALLDHVQVLPTARIDVAEPEPASPHVGLIVRVHEHLGLIAGEHGFRFFPGFYRHLRDTMQRTPIFDTVTQTFTARTPLDHLKEVAWQVIADPECRDRLAISRKPFSTIGGLIEQYRAMRRDLGYRPIDVLRFSLRMLRYMTSSIKRRETYYEKMSWWTFLSKPHLDDPREEPPFNYGRRFAAALRHSPQALVAMSAEVVDARTLGNISVQLLMGQFDLHDQNDSTLSGPTSTSWLCHWRTYLEEQGVRFLLGEVTRITSRASRDGQELRANIDVAFTDPSSSRDYLDGEARKTSGDIGGHYIVSALDIVGLARVTTALRANGCDGALVDIDNLISNVNGNERDLEDITQIGQREEYGGLGDRFQTLTGIQLYYRRQVPLANGHIYFAGSPWGLSAISQVQFWGTFGSGHRGQLTGNLSIDIGSWRADDAIPNPNHLSRDAIAATVQAQLAGNATADYYHLDDLIGFGPAEECGGEIRPRRNHAPFLINVVDDWDARPRGEPWSPNDLASRGRKPGIGVHAGTVWTPECGGYLVHYDNLVIAGPHMRTFTRMSTMEAANESARHAVNTILDHASSHHVAGEHCSRTLSAHPTPNINLNKSTTLFGGYCDIWNPELLELQDLEFLRKIDGHLMDAVAKSDGQVQGSPSAPAPHLFDILRIDELPDLMDDDRTALGALELIGGILRAFDDAQIDDLPSVFAAVERARSRLANILERGVR